jgi:hypothetical protein
MEAILRGLSAGALSNLLGHDGINAVAGLFLAALVFAIVTREIGRFTGANRASDGEMILRGSYVLIVYGGAALIFVAAVAWAWRSLFG